MMSRVLSPAAALQPTSSIAQLGGMIDASDAIPALGFARAGPGPSTSRRPVQSGMANRSDTAHGFTPESSYPLTQTQNAPPALPPSRHPSQAFSTSMRNADARYNPLLVSRHGYPQRASNSSNTLPNNSVLASRLEAPSRLGQPSRVAFASGPGSLVQSRSTVPQNYNPPSASRSPQPQSQLGPTSSTTAPTGRYSYQAATSAATPPMASLVPPPSLTSMHRRTPPPPKLNLQPGAINRPTTAASSSSNRQAAFIDSPIDYYSRLDSKVPALPPNSAYEDSPQSSVPAGPLISIQTPDVTPTHNKSFEIQQRQPYVHPQRYLSAQPAQVRPQAPSFDNGIRMCVVCFESEPTVRFAARSPTGDCMHGATVCTSCLEYHILIAIHHCGNVDVRCPHEGCEEMLEYRDIYASVRDWGRLTYYEVLLLKREAESNRDFVWCKNTQCKSGQIHKAGKQNPIVICATCNAKSCFTHDRPWHEGLTCEQFDKIRRDEEQNKATDRYLAQNTKECPKCHRKIERNGGCDHMVCRPPGGCGHDFCWECLENDDHKPTCSHYSGHHIAATRRNRRRR